MPKRRKKRRKPQQLPRASRARSQVARPDAVLPTTVRAERAVVAPSLDDNRTDEAVAERSSTIRRRFGRLRRLMWRPLRAAVAVWSLAPRHTTDGWLTLMAAAFRRHPRYVKALVVHQAGDCVSGTIRAIAPSAIYIDVGGVVCIAPRQELSLSDGEEIRDRYSLGDVVAVFVLSVRINRSMLDVSVRRNAPDYVEALSAYSVGNVISATVTAFWGDGGLWLDVDGVIGSISPREMSLADGESALDHYAVGDTVHDLFVWQVDLNARDLDLSIKRNVSGYLEALSAHSVGDFVSATITAIEGNGGLLLDVGGVIGHVPPWELSLTDGESTRDRYAVGDTVHALFVWQVSCETRHLSLSARRNTPSYVEALNAHNISDVVSATVTDFWGNGGLWLDVGGVTGSVGPQELSFAGSGSAQDHYAVGDIIRGLFVWDVYHDTRHLSLSARRNAPGLVKRLDTYAEALDAHSVGDVVSGIVIDTTDDALILDVGGGVIGRVGPQELFLADGESSQDRYSVGDTVHDLFIWQMHHDIRALSLCPSQHARLR